MHGIHLSRLPLSAKVFCSLFLLGIGCGALAAFAQAATAVGVSPSAVRESLAPDLPMTGMRHGEMSAEQEIDLGQLTRTAIGGMWATRFVSPSLSVLVIAGGTLFALGYVLIAALSMHDLWLRKETA